MAGPLIDPLAGMQGLDLPPAVSPWPPAPGWWALLLLLLLLAFTLGRWRYRRGALRRAALAELAAIEAAHRRRDDGRALARDLSRLLRRLALARHPRGRVAGLQGSAWLDFLDHCLGGHQFRSGPGRVLASLPYGGSAPLDADALLALVRRWIERCT